MTQQVLIGDQAEPRPAPVAPRPRLVHLDGLRGLAALAVIVGHSFEFPASPIQPGITAVYLFFVLSGYLITGILLDSRGRPIARTLALFYARRSLRIFPLYYASLAFAAAIGAGEVRRLWPWYVTYTFNWYSGHLLYWLQEGLVFVHFWTLCVEEQFYLAWPALVLLVPARWLPWTFAAFAASSPMMYTALLYLRPGTLTAYTSTFSNIGFMAVGAMGAWWARERPGRWGSLAAWSLGAGSMTLTAVFALFFTTHRLASIRDGIAPIGQAGVWLAVILWAAEGCPGPASARRFLSWRPLVYVGAISYGVYVYHMLLPLSFGYIYMEMGWRRFLAIAPATLALAALSWHFFEAPINGLKARLPR